MFALEGERNNELVDGFFLQTHVAEPPTGNAKSSTASPYAHGSYFFFKVQFDELYMVYRYWCQVTCSRQRPHIYRQASQVQDETRQDEVVCEVGERTDQAG